jgi:uncharacterized protein (TIGR03435 family)
MRVTVLVALSLAGLAAQGAPLAAERTVQAPPVATAAADELTFRTVSLTRNTTNPGPTRFNVLPNGSYEIVNQSLMELLQLAYPGYTLDRGSLPRWAITESYDLTATSPLARPATSEDRQVMLRALLRDRFNVQTHLRVHEEPVYDLVLAREDGRLGPNMAPSPVDCTSREEAISFAEAMERAQALTDSIKRGLAERRDEPPGDCSLKSNGSLVTGDISLSSGGFPMLLRFKVDRTVVNKTGLTGYYRIHLMSAGINEPASAEAPDIFTALTEQLGLKLEESTTLVPTLIVDRVEALKGR